MSENTKIFVIDCTGKRGLIPTVNIENVPVNNINALRQAGRLYPNDGLSSVTVYEVSGDKRSVIATLTPEFKKNSDGEWSDGEWSVTPKGKETVNLDRANTTRPDRKDKTGQTVKVNDVDVGVDLQETVRATVNLVYPETFKRGGGGGGSISDQTRQNIIELHKVKMTVKKIATILDLHENTVQRVIDSL